VSRSGLALARKIRDRVQQARQMARRLPSAAMPAGWVSITLRLQSAITQDLGMMARHKKALRLLSGRLQAMSVKKTVASQSATWLRGVESRHGARICTRLPSVCPQASLDRALLLWRSVLTLGVDMTALFTGLKQSFPLQLAVALAHTRRATTLLRLVRTPPLTLKVIVRLRLAILQQVPRRAIPALQSGFHPELQTNVLNLSLLDQAQAQ
jgi:hypothetical protein